MKAAINRLGLGAALLLSSAAYADGFPRYDAVPLSLDWMRTPDTAMGAAGLTNDGEIVGSVGSRGYRWTRTGGFTWLEGTHIGLAAVNDSGVIAGYGFFDNGTTASTIDRAGVVVDIAGMKPKRRWWPSFSTAISNSGIVVGFENRSDDLSTEYVNWIWSAEKGLRRLDSLPQGDLLGVPKGVNSSGALTGPRSGPKGLIAYYWTEEGGLIDIKGFDDVPFAINDKGTVVGGQEVPFLWHRDSGLVRLPVLPGTTWCQAQSVNESDVAVGICYGVKQPRSAVIWAKGDDGVYAVRSLLELTDTHPGRSGCLSKFCTRSSEAQFINDAGQIAVRTLPTRVVDSDIVLLTPKAAP